MKVLFVIHDLGFADNLAIACLSAIAKQINHSTFICLLDRENLGDRVEEIKPDVVAFSVNIIGYDKVVKAHSEARKRHRYVSIMGGPHATLSPETFTQSGMDAYCIGEGEYAFRDFLLRVAAGQPFDDVENLITNKKTNPVRPLIQNLDELPDADRDLIIANSFLRDTPKKTFHATRGCPFKCAYCCNNHYHRLYTGKGPFVRRFSVERLIREIEDVKKKYRTEFIKFGDDVFAMKADKWMEEFVEKYTNRIGLPFNCYLRFDTVDDALLKLLKKAGCFSVHLSVDSTSEHIRQHILKRNMRGDNILQNLKKIRGYGINTFVNYMLAIPESILNDDLDTIRLSREADVTYPHYTTTIPMKGTELYDYCVKKGILDPNSSDNNMNNMLERSTLPCFTAREKDIRYNIFLLGALLSKIPRPFDRLALSMIKIVPPNSFFKRIHDIIYDYYMTHKIYKLPKGA